MRIVLLLVASLTPCFGASSHVLVMPFTQDRTPPAKNSNLAWMGESVSEAIVETLANSGLLVTSREERLDASRRLSVKESATLTRATVLKLGQTLDVDEAIYGSFQESADGRLTITAHALHVRELRQGWEHTVASPVAELSALQHQLAWEVLRGVAPALAPSAEEFYGKKPVIKLEAMEQYVRGLLAESADAKHRFLTQAARLDERFGPARFELGRLQYARNNYREAIGWLERIPSNDALYHQARFLAGLSYFYVSDYAGAEQAFSLVERNLPLAEVLNNLGAALSRQGRFEEALRQFEQASQADPQEAAFHFNRGYVLWRLRRLPLAAMAFRKALESRPEDQEPALFLQMSEQPPDDALADPRFQARERLRTRLEESAYRQLKAVLQKQTK